MSFNQEEILADYVGFNQVKVKANEDRKPSHLEINCPYICDPDFIHVLENLRKRYAGEAQKKDKIAKKLYRASTYVLSYIYYGFHYKGPLIESLPKDCKPLYHKDIPVEYEQSINDILREAELNTYAQ